MHTATYGTADDIYAATADSMLLGYHTYTGMIRIVDLDPETGAHEVIGYIHKVYATDRRPHAMVFHPSPRGMKNPQDHPDYRAFDTATDAALFIAEHATRGLEVYAA
jgi:hypothetical protein